MFPPQASFHSVTRWRLSGPPDRIAALLTHPEDFPRWWGDVYLACHTVAKGDARGIGRTVQVLSKGWLPYRLTWQGKLLSADLPHSWTIEATGDLIGQGLWTLTPDDAGTLVTHDWQVRSDRLLFRLLFPALRWLMISNHNWAMERGEAGLRWELLA